MEYTKRPSRLRVARANSGPSRRYLYCLCLCVVLFGPRRLAGYTLKGNALFKRSTLERVIGNIGRLQCMQAGRRAKRRLLRHYLRRGYRLARVRYTCDQPELAIELDEGRLGKVIVKGIDTFRCIFFATELRLPNNVFHAVDLKRRLRRFKRKFKLDQIRYRLRIADVQSRSNRWSEPQFDLYLNVKQRGVVGLRVEAEYTSDYGLLTGVGYRLVDAGLSESYWQVMGWLGIDVVRAIDRRSARQLWSHAGLSTRYSFPPIRNFAALQVKFRFGISNLSRISLNLERYYLLDGAALLGFEFQVARWLNVRAAGGAEYFRLFDPVLVDKRAAVIAPFSIWRGIFELEAHFNFSPHMRRTDHQTTLGLRLAYHIQRHASDLVSTQIQGQHIMTFGYHDLIIRGRALWLFLAPQFFDLVPLGGKFMRAFFDSRYFVRRAAQFTLEARFSVYKDIFKIGLFNDFSIFGKLEQQESKGAMVANAFGPGLHALLFDILQLNLNYALGFAQSQFSHNIYLSIHTVY